MFLVEYFFIMKNFSIGLLISIFMNWFIFFVIGVNDDLSLANGNDYYQEHLLEHIIYTFHNSFNYYSVILLIIIFTLFFLVLRGITLNKEIHPFMSFFVMPILSNLLSLYIFFLFIFGAFSI